MFQPTTRSREKSLKTFKLLCEDFRTNFSQYPAFFIRKIIFEAQFQLIYLAFPPQPPFKVKVLGDFQTNHKTIPFFSMKSYPIQLSYNPPPIGSSPGIYKGFREEIWRFAIVSPAILLEILWRFVWEQLLFYPKMF